MYREAKNERRVERNVLNREVWKKSRQRMKVIESGMDTRNAYLVHFEDNYMVKTEHGTTWREKILMCNRLKNCAFM